MKERPLCFEFFLMIRERESDFENLVQTTNTLLPVQAAFPLFLCPGVGQLPGLDPVAGACENKIIYIRRSELSLTLVYLSTEGILQPIPDPTVEVGYDSWRIYYFLHQLSRCG